MEIKSEADLIRMQAIIQSLERMCTEARTRELHKDAAIAILQDQLNKVTVELAKLKPKEDQKATNEQRSGDSERRNGLVGHSRRRRNGTERGGDEQGAARAQSND